MPISEKLVAQVRAVNPKHKLAAAKAAGIECGKMLLEVKRTIPHGGWWEFLTQCNLNDNTARRYMRMAQKAVKAENVSH